MWPWKKSDTKKNKNLEKNKASISIDIKSVKEAIRKFADDAKPGITTKVLVQDDHSIDFELLLPYLNGYPDKPFYMSKETYEVFQEAQKDIPQYLDMIQEAVDRYIDMYQKLPTIPGDPYQKVSYLILESNNLIQERPPLDFYITNEENLITYKKPE